ncbi:MAG: GatB/YqeY domain-containing protein [gamma proteobacterium symbiont of Bathyaustriella thionipta]|nr:GatB/YqeY domain-containing protein [gamma proteobacterium symbiont of Bathyaustriella thionipta]MCU7950270.1 GatB/YqeY domain-containing protein [gamma proteobacterium symbiont of Bathyaustriella thionipta]MCU7953408.1 GatB/YqeY domain-containing protein [gamma proteobacterium symbiont of Bathyaustriella thionipta]MCU7956787.1 GatB/YqeY domain-containing protein [gamma proteobacterium symbiont of Bathyaustriella thionipta]
MSQTLKSRLQDDMKNAMRAKEKDRLVVIRGTIAAVKQREIDERIELDDTQILAILDKLVKQRRDSAQQFRDAERLDLAEKEEMEMGILQEYLPVALTEAEIAQLIDEAISTTGAQSMKEMGKVMGMLKPQVQGRADMSQVSTLIKQKLA